MIYIYNLETREDDTDELVGAVQIEVEADSLFQAHIKALHRCQLGHPFLSQYTVFQGIQKAELT